MSNPKISKQAAWDKYVRDYYRDTCVNCGSKDHTRPKMIVPEAVGGQYIMPNFALLCRSCEMAADSVTSKHPDKDQRLINIWVSRPLYDRIQTSLGKKTGFSSMGALVRYLITKYQEDPTRYDDLDMYQDEGSDAKINLWVNKEVYDKFKRSISAKGYTVTSTVKSLICMYHAHEVTLETTTNG